MRSKRDRKCHFSHDIECQKNITVLDSWREEFFCVHNKHMGMLTIQLTSATGSLGRGGALHLMLVIILLLCTKGRRVDFVLQNTVWFWSRDWFWSCVNIWDRVWTTCLVIFKFILRARICWTRTRTFVKRGRYYSSCYYTNVFYLCWWEI